MYPRIVIDLSKIGRNAEKVIEVCQKSGIQVVGITKLMAGESRIAEKLVDCGINLIGDSRMQNLVAFDGLDVKKMLIRIPMISESEQIAKHTDIVLVSEPKTAKAIGKAAKSIGKTIELIQMVDLGDLREGLFYEEELLSAIESYLDVEGIKLVGIGTNLSCFGGVMPTEEKLNELLGLKQLIEARFGITLKIISGGNSGSFTIMMNDKLPKGINNLRIGSAILMGFGLNDEPFENLELNTVTLEAELVEVRKKPSKPIGEIGLDAFGKVPVFEDRGVRLRGICAVGKQDIRADDMMPIDDGIMILGSSSDHLILDLEDSLEDYAVGDIVKFNLTYGGALSAMTSQYVRKIIENN